MCQQGAGALCDGTCLELSPADMVWWSTVFKTLGDPVRLHLLMHLAEHRGAEVAVHELADVGVSQATVSHHLKRLRCIGLIESRREGRHIYYRLGDEVRSALMQILHQRSRVGA
ncbi:ArsR/SmtB family transcription factor [Streptomyces capillispiralis]|uniref:DNA-binding transcriptional ArsR family regulator n=1 Tax=Streptomyces capillispiralis TaxID=68182 RepID=A0A561TAP2_9ACTN|nr:metalloregulator ArsR/SmtB family transcription factor [Streptomyces capillispiralis]TWF84149.1 DNA-binding transcriptional ArsR family regulator [Streptomyces capillispiralis]GHH92956.1 transcriptional regulator [Streptomyces capillispiralis]